MASPTPPPPPPPFPSLVPHFSPPNPSPPPLKSPIRQRLHVLHSHIPLLRKLPARAVAIVLVVALVNCAVWAAAGVVLRFNGELTGTAVLAYTFGLRHALDADHISAIDLMTRRLVASNQRPVTVGTWFSLGHSTIVIITCIVVAATATAISHKFASFSYIGGIIGSSVSAAFLLLLGLANAYVLLLLLRRLRTLLSSPPQPPQNPTTTPQTTLDLHTHGGGCLIHLLARLFTLIDRPWKMYPLGVAFGLGFDTSSEIALLGLASLRAAQGTSLWLILLFPLLFTAGMCLLDTLDGALMMALYTSTSLAADPVAVLYYNVVLTGVTVVVAAAIGTLQCLGLGLAVLGPRDGFWEGVQRVQDRWDVIGAGVCALFVVAGAGSVLLYGPWRRWVGRGAWDEEVGMRQGLATGDADESVFVELLERPPDLELATRVPVKGGEQTAAAFPRLEGGGEVKLNDGLLTVRELE